ncbi:MAG: bifunctional riboflavin kinase/FAD synthetase [Bacteroides sp.]|nr:bifunctional riboflavin kinase/FAD synthetase [Bacillota bacterium]MCM1393866.1 bifunctional riboflavin kinase/FAD synthetase [[Eubacterium] siraeum]MCM1456206.1 bifunctional riboflavin kinase/FAD synthetase [Bacteroides sp.]
MRILDFKDKLNTPIAVALGFFDCIHKGHCLLVRSACEYASAHLGVESALFTFSNDPSSCLTDKEKQIYNFDERAEALKNLGLENLIYTEFNKSFSSLEPIEFLDTLTENLNIKAVIIGHDYTFGKEAKGNISLIRSYFKDKSVDVITVPYERLDGKKISTSSLKALVKEGNIETLNSQLSEPYFMLGKVVHARHVGTELGFPTANINVSETRLPLAEGVYATILQADNRRYPSMTNVGAKPTFGIESPSIETYILDFDGNLYDKTVKLSFVARMRDVFKFTSLDDLKNQLVHDKAQVGKLIKI